MTKNSTFPIIRVVAPGRRITEAVAERTRDLFNASPAAARYTLEFAPQCFHLAGHFAGTDLERTKALRDALEDESVAIVWCAKGGYGSCRLLDGLRNLHIPKPKILAGYSDTGTLACALYGTPHLDIYYMPMPGDLLTAPPREAGIVRALTAFAAMDSETVSASDKPRGFVINLTVLVSTLGTEWEPNLDGHYLIVEDTSLHLYAVDRLFFQLSSWTGIQRLVGIGLGQFTNILPNDVDFGLTVEEIARHWLEPKGFEVTYGYRVGHCDDNKNFRQGNRDWSQLKD